jgi:hypothetical protein
MTSRIARGRKRRYPARSGKPLRLRVPRQWDACLAVKNSLWIVLGSSEEHVRRLQQEAGRGDHDVEIIAVRVVEIPPKRKRSKA